MRYLLFVDVGVQAGEFLLGVQLEQVRVTDESARQDEMVRRGAGHELVEDVDRVFAATDERADQPVGVVALDCLQAAQTGLESKSAISLVVRKGDDTGWDKPARAGGRCRGQSSDQALHTPEPRASCEEYVSEFSFAPLIPRKRGRTGC